MYSFDDIKSRSVSSDEIVVSYTDAMELLCIFEKSNTIVLGWEGWVKHIDGSVAHSQKHQGTANLSHMSIPTAIGLIKSTIMQAHTDWGEKPEVSNAELLFCITTNT